MFKLCKNPIRYLTTTVITPLRRNIAASIHTAVKEQVLQKANVVFRSATEKDIDIITSRAIQEGWHVGPYDFSTFFNFDPKGFIIGEVKNELAIHGAVLEYPGHHYHGGSIIVTKKFQGNKMAKEAVAGVMQSRNWEYTVGTDVYPDTNGFFQPLGFRKFWDTYVAMLDIKKVAQATKTHKTDMNVSIVPIHNVDIPKLLQYDESVFGTERQRLMKRWINTPGSFGWATIDKASGNITGYAVVKQVIRGSGTEIGLAIAPLFADDKDTAKCLIKRIAKECVTNPAIPKVKLELFHPVGDICGEGAGELMEELEAEMTHIAQRIYTKGVPQGRQTRKIYGIVSPSCD